ncbi:MAG TPA: hypothetical protein VGQ93_00470, partial [Lysobacter sp.]|nr:hypothetical protein [Lysobacter sp.]
ELREQGSSLAPDPVGEFWAWATRGLLSVRDVGFGFPLMFALVIEVVSAFGPSVVVAVAAATRAGSSMPQPAPAGLSRAQQAATHMAGDSVLHWLADRTEPTSDPVAITIQALYADYAAWCASTCVHLSEPNAFAAEFDRVRTLPELASKIRKFGDRYCGLRLLRAPVRRIASANDA